MSATWQQSQDIFSTHNRKQPATGTPAWFGIQSEFYFSGLTFKSYINLLIVVTNIEPPGFRSWEHFLIKFMQWLCFQNQQLLKWVWCSAIREENLWVVHMLYHFTCYNSIITRSLKVFSMLKKNRYGHNFKFDILFTSSEVSRDWHFPKTNIKSTSSTVQHW